MVRLPNAAQVPAAKMVYVSDGLNSFTPPGRYRLPVIGCSGMFAGIVEKKIAIKIASMPSRFKENFGALG
jgi:hypothetical protein